MKEGGRALNYKIMANQNRYEIIDFAKGFSILTIVLMHFIQNFMNYVPHAVSLAATVGGSGVHVFIFCSGFGLYLSYLKHSVNYGSFLKSRFLKIYVPYIMIIVISALVPYMYQESDRIVALLSHLFLFKMFMPQYEESFGGQFWFISTIIQFYLIFIPLCKFKKRIGNRKLFLALTIAVSVIYWVFIACIHKETVRVWNSFLLQYLWEFSLGMYFAEMLYEGKNISINKIWLWILSVILLAVMGVMGIIGGAAKIFNDIPALLGYGGICLGVYFWKIGIIKKMIMFISSISYELFLVHILVGKTISVVFGKFIHNLASETIMVVGMFGISLLIAYVFHWMLNLRKSRKKHNRI